MGFPGGSEGKASACNVGDQDSIPGSGRAPGEGNGNPLQYSCLENPMEGGAWWATVHGVAKSWTRLSDFTFFLRLLMMPVCVKSLQSCLTLCDPMDCSSPGSLSMEFSRQEYWSWLPFSPPGDLLNPGTEPASFVSSALAVKFFTTALLEKHI